MGSGMDSRLTSYMAKFMSYIKKSMSILKLFISDLNPSIPNENDGGGRLLPVACVKIDL